MQYFESHLFYASLAWARNTNSVKRLQLLQNKSLRIMFLRNRNFHTSPLLKDFEILKPFDERALENYIFITKSLKGLLPPVFNRWFKLSFESHSHNTRWSILGYVKIPCYCTKSYGRYSMFVNAVCLESLSKLLSIHFISWEQINWKRCLLLNNKTSVCIYKLSILQRRNFLWSLSPSLKTFPLVLDLL